MGSEPTKTGSDGMPPALVTPPWEVGQRVQLKEEYRGFFGTVVDTFIRDGAWEIKVYWHPLGFHDNYDPVKLVAWKSPVLTSLNETRLIKLNSRNSYRVTDRELNELRQFDDIIESIGLKHGQRSVYLTKRGKKLAEMFQAERGVLRKVKAAMRPAPTRDGIRKDLEELLAALQKDGGSVARPLLIHTIKRILEGSFRVEDWPR